MEPLNAEFLPKTEHGDIFPRLPWNYPKPAPFLHQDGGKVVDNKKDVFPI
jgi:hypothetical protein